MNNKDATVITFNSQKGGVGKSVLSYNFAVYEANRGLRVLYIDTDFQKNSTSNFENVSASQKRNSSIFRAFIHDSKDPKKPFPNNLRPVPAKPNIDLMASSSHINDAERLMNNNNKGAFSPYVILHIFTALKLVQKYDLIIIDTHNSMNLSTINAIVVSNYVVSPIIPNRYGITAISGMMTSISHLKQDLLNPVTQQSMVNCKLLFVGNMIRKVTKIGKEFIQSTKNNKHFVAEFPDRELFNKATTIYESIYELASQDSKTRKIVDTEIDPEFKKLSKATIK